MALAYYTAHQSELELLLHHFLDALMRLSRRTARIHRYNASRLAPGNRREAFAHAAEERPCLLLEAVLVMAADTVLRNSFIAATCSANAGVWIRIQKQGQVGLQVPAQNAMQLPHCVAAQPAPAPLISFG